jgi:hypothetical protein
LYRIGTHFGRALGFCAAISLAQPLYAESYSLTKPFAVHNQNPFVLAYGLPSATSANLLSAGEASLQLQVDLTNHSKRSETSSESIILDGESYRTALIYRRGMADGWQLGMELPLISHRSGFMDNFIENWHDTFGLPNGDRDPWPNNRLLFSYSRDGVVVEELSSGTTGVGDLQLLVSRRLMADSNRMSWALNASLDLPTGDVDRLQGSGSVDLAIWLSGAAPSLVEKWRIGGYLQAGWLRPGNGDLLSDQQERSVWFGSAGLHWRAWPWLMLKAQLDGHSALYDSGLDQLGKRSMMLTTGASMPLERFGGVLDLAIGENLVTDTVPDFMVNLSYRHRF